MVKSCVISAEQLNKILNLFSDWYNEHKNIAVRIPYSDWRNIQKKIKEGGEFTLKIAKFESCSGKDALIFKIFYNDITLYSEIHDIKPDIIGFTDWIYDNWDEIISFHNQVKIKFKNNNYIKVEKEPDEAKRMTTATNTLNGITATNTYTNTCFTATTTNTYPTGTTYLTTDVSYWHNEDKNANKSESKKEENKEMKMFNFDFGWIKDNDNIRLSPYGLAVKDVNGKWVAYDKNTGDLMDVDVFNFNADNCFFKMPCAIKDIAIGHVIIHQRKPMVVTEITNGNIWAIDPMVGERKCIVPLKNMFGFNFVVRVMSLFDNFMGQMETASADQPFGNMLPLMMLNSNGKANRDTMLAMMMMNGKMDMSNPMMLMLMCDDNKNNDFLSMMLLGQMMNNQK